MSARASRERAQLEPTIPASFDECSALANAPVARFKEGNEHIGPREVGRPRVGGAQLVERELLALTLRYRGREPSPCSSARLPGNPNFLSAMGCPESSSESAPATRPAQLIGVPRIDAASVVTRAEGVCWRSECVS